MPHSLCPSTAICGVVNTAALRHRGRGARFNLACSEGGRPRLDARLVDLTLYPISAIVPQPLIDATYPRNFWALHCGRWVQHRVCG